MRFTVVDSPIDELLLVADDEGLRRLHMLPHAISSDWRRADDDPILATARRQLDAYFAGALTEFDLPLAPEGTAFQRLVWDGLRTIPYGETRSYGELAEEIGAPGAARAVGLANGRNPIAVIIPCHRVIGADGSLTGFGGGLPRKRTLLSLELETLGQRPERAVVAGRLF
jgi:methylated-DNA-[protein]-cysteine S-methyltransferase